MQQQTIDTRQFGREILRCEVGSTAHGTSVEGGDDLDLMAIVIPDPDRVLGLTPFEHHIYRTAELRAAAQERDMAVSVAGQPIKLRVRPAPRSEPGDIDLTIYSLRKFVGLAKKGNPSILNMFFAPILIEDGLGAELRASSHLFQSKEAGFRFLGYMKAQRERLTGERGQKRCNRTELVEKFGYDTKYAYHILRLGMQGLEFVKTGKINMPMLPWYADLLLAVRNGNYTEEKVLEWGKELEDELLSTIDNSNLPESAPPEPINDLLVRLHYQAWH